MKKLRYLANALHERTVNVNSKLCYSLNYSILNQFKNVSCTEIDIYFLIHLQHRKIAFLTNKTNNYEQIQCKFSFKFLNVCLSSVEQPVPQNRPIMSNDLNRYGTNQFKYFGVRFSPCL